jgi:cysteine desulfurase
MQLPIYLDYNATTPVDERVLDRMMPYFREQYGNPSSAGHPYGWTAEEAVDQAREQVADLLGAEPRALTFTSGATEALNAAIKGVAATYGDGPHAKGRHIVTVQTEHKAVLDTCQALERQGFEVTYLPVDDDGRLTPEAVTDALRDDTLLVAVMWANNETGVLQPIADIAAAVADHQAFFLTDATQAVGKVPVSVENIDLLVASGHKVYGPKGVGVLYAQRRRPRVNWTPLIDGGGQEDGRRGGTLNVPAIVGLGAAAQLANEEQADDAARLAGLRNRLESALTNRLDDVHINGAAAPRLPQTTNVTFPGLDADDLMLALRDVACSTGSACSSNADKPSHVLRAHGLSDEDARATVRLSLGRPTTEEEVDHAIDCLVEAVEEQRAMPSLSL